MELENASIDILMGLSPSRAMRALQRHSMLAKASTNPTWESLKEEEESTEPPVGMQHSNWEVYRGDCANYTVCGL